jgi:type II secretory pathway pseudopilin PulG
MRGLKRKIRRRLADEAGFSLIEALVSTIVGLMVVGIGATVFTTAGRSQPDQVKRGASIQDSRNTIERMTREIRQGSTVYSSTATQLSLLTYVRSASCGGTSADAAIQCKVTYTCTSGNCTRVEAPPPGSTGSPGSPRTVVSGLSASGIFRYGSSCNLTTTAGAPGYVCVTLTYPAGNGDDALTLRDGAAPINPTAS